MLWRFVLLFTAVPLAELWLLLWLSRVTSVTHTILLVIATGVVGAALARRQGWQTWRKIQEQLARGQSPTGVLLDGLMILIAGALLITPGILTDLVGFALLVPRLRAVLRSRMASWLKSRTKIQFRTYRADGSTESHQTHGDSVIDAEYTRRGDDQDERDD